MKAKNMFLQQCFQIDGTTTEAAPLETKQANPRFGRMGSSACLDVRVAVIFAVLFVFA